MHGVVISRSQAEAHLLFVNPRRADVTRLVALSPVKPQVPISEWQDRGGRGGPGPSWVVE